MTDRSNLALSLRRSGSVSAAIIVRVTFAAMAICLAIAPVLAGERPALKGDVTAKTDVLTLGDLVQGISGAGAEKPLFRAPALGQTGTIQVRRILEAATDLGFGALESGGRTQITITRAARRAGLAEIEGAVKRVLETQAGLDTRALSIVFDGAPPALVVAPDVEGPVMAEDVVYDRRSRRVQALVVIAPAGGERRAPTRVAGAVVETVEVAVLARSLNRGDSVQASDIALERRAKELVPSDVHADGFAFAGRVARRALSAGAVVRTGDLARPEIVARNEVVTIVYEVPGMVLTLRGRANEAGAQGDMIAVLNPATKKTLQGIVIGPGKVSVNAPLPGRVAANASPLRP